MSSQSRYVHNEQPAGLGQIATEPMVYDGQATSHPDPMDKTAPVRTTTLPPVVQPISTTTSKPQTGGSHPIINPETDAGSKPSGETATRPPLVKADGGQLVINGTHRIGKKKAALVGGGLLGAAVLLKLTL